MKGKFMELENKNNILPQIVSHPLTKMEFEELFNNNGKLFNLYSEFIKQKIGNSLGLPLDIVKTITLGKASSGEFVIFSEDVFKGLKEGRYYQPVSKKDGLISAVAHNRKDGTIVEHGRVGRRMTSVLSVGIGIAHTISNLDMQNQLEEIKDAVDRIHRFQVSNRIGDLKGVYDTLQNWLDRVSREGLTVVNKIKGQDISERLDKLEHQFFETAKMELETIKNPADYGRGILGFFKHLNFFGKTPEQKAKEKLKTAFENLQYTKICNFLNLLVCGELEDTDAYKRTNERLYYKFEKIHNTLDLKSQYSIEVCRALKEGEILVQELNCIDKRRKLELSIKVMSDGERKN